MPITKLDTSRMLRVHYTDAERLELGKKLADEHADLRQVNSDFDRVKAEFKSKISTREAKIEDFSNKVSTGFRVEDVKCRWQMDTPTPGFKSLVRLDLHETVESVEMTAADKQSEMELSPAGAVGSVSG